MSCARKGGVRSRRFGFGTLVCVYCCAVAGIAVFVPAAAAAANPCDFSQIGVEELMKVIEGKQTQKQLQQQQGTNNVQDVKLNETKIKPGGEHFVQDEPNQVLLLLANSLNQTQIGPVETTTPAPAPLFLTTPPEFESTTPINFNVTPEQVANTISSEESGESLQKERLETQTTSRPPDTTAAVTTTVAVTNIGDDSVHVLDNQTEQPSTSTISSPKLYTNLTEREQDMLRRFRPLVEHSLVHGYQKLDTYLLRWLTAKNFDLDASAKFLLDAQLFRHTNGINTILNETIFTFSPPPYSLAGIDRAGDPFIAFTPTSLDLRRIIVSGNGNKVGRYWIQIMEAASFNTWRVSNRTGRETSRGGCLLDLSGFNIVQHGCISCIPIYLEWAISYENLYPDFATYIIWINVPRIFMPVFELVKPFMSPTTRKVLQVFGTDKREWSAMLHSLIPPDQLSIRFGGTRKS